MKRIKTFKLFESAGAQGAIGNANIQAAIDVLGPEFAPLGWGFTKWIQVRQREGLAQSDTWLLEDIGLGEEGGKTGNDKHPLLRVLLCQILFDTPSESVRYLMVGYDYQVVQNKSNLTELTGMGFQIKFDEHSTDFDFRMERRNKLENSPIVLFTPLSATSEEIYNWLRGIMGEVITSIRSVRAQLEAITVPKYAPALYDEPTSGKMASAIASALVDKDTQESNQFLADTIAQHIRETEGSKTRLISLISDHLPRVWVLLKPMLGKGADATGNLADLGF